LCAVVHEAEIGIRVEKILGDGRVRAGVGLLLEVEQVVLDGSRLRMLFRIAATSM